MAGHLVLGLVLLPLPCQAQAPAHSAAGGMVSPWTKVPAVVVVGANANDARLPLVQDAVAFWNRSFAELGSAFRLGPLTQAAGAIPGEELRAMSDRVLSRTGPTQFPESLRGVPGDLIVALSDGDFISFGMRWPSLGKALVAIKSDGLWPQQLCDGIDVRPSGSVPAGCVRVWDRALFPADRGGKGVAAEPLPRRLGTR